MQIGEQCWFAENLRAENYRNGDAIPAGLSDSEWVSTTEGATTVYQNGAANLEQFGRLYNWFAVAHEGAMCPHGWHVPTDDEVMTLELSIGAQEAEVGSTGWRAEGLGQSLKSESGWVNNTGIDSYGMTMVGGGSRFYNDGNYIDLLVDGLWWTSQEGPNNGSGWARKLKAENTGIYRGYEAKNHGFSVRCIKDAE